MKNVCNNVRVSSYCICYLDGNIKSENNRTFTYDNLGRLKQEQDGTDTISYTYDKFGNRSTMTNNETVTSYTYDLNNRLLQEVSGDEFTFYNYDNRGNLYSKRTEERSAAGGLTCVDTFGALKDNTNSTVELYSYDGLNRMSEVRKGGITAQYTYNAEGIRTSKTVNGVTTDFLLDGSNVVAETKDNITTNYIRGVSGIISSSIQGTNDSTKYYTSDGHGNITNLTDSTGVVVKTYTYDAFGVEQNIDSNDTNPFRYCGEYYDSEINQIYLRARYYSPTIGRFTQQDPARDGYNWYVYCGNNPMNLIDPLGLFDYNTRLTMNMQYSEDVEVLQNELIYLGYLQRKDVNWGYFDGKTLVAVNRYKNAMGFGNSGKDRGVVGLQTWTSLGLQYRTKKDIEAGVVMVMWGGRRQYKDISKVVNDALWDSKWEFEEHQGDFNWFAKTVGDDGKWNIKRDSSKWENALRMTFPGYETPMLLKGQIVYVEDVGNITYGYLGTATKFSADILIAGSAGNHILNHGAFGWKNELSDEEAIFKGIAWFYGNWYGQ